MKIALLRVGIDTGCGGIHGPLFQDGRFEYVPIPSESAKDGRTYGNVRGRYGGSLVEYFSEHKQARMKDSHIHFDPEFETFTYGDPTRPKAGLRHLQKGDFLVFYAGLQGFDFARAPALYLIGYFIVKTAGLAKDFSRDAIRRLFRRNYHIITKDRRPGLVLVKGAKGSRLLEKALCISEEGADRNGKPLKVLSRKMRRTFGDFAGKVGIQRSPPRWIREEPWLTKTVTFLERLV